MHENSNTAGISEIVDWGTARKCTEPTAALSVDAGFPAEDFEQLQVLSSEYIIALAVFYILTCTIMETASFI